MSARIAIIGAGSATFSLSLIRDLCLTPNLRGSTVYFMDVDEARLNSAFRLCQRYAGEMGIHFDLRKTTDRREALQDADFVVNTALVAGHAQMNAGWEIARQYGYRHGGSLHIMHDEAFWVNYYQFKLFESIVEDMLEICPQGWLLLVANPVFAGITYLGRKYPQAKIVGLCHGFRAVYKIAEKLGLDADAISCEIPGVNHFVWLTHLYHAGEDVMPLLMAQAGAEDDKARSSTEQAHAKWPKKLVDLYRRFGVYPIGDTGTTGGGSWGWWYHRDAETEANWDEDPNSWWQRYIVSRDEQVQNIMRVAGDESTQVSAAFPPKHSSEVMIPLIESIACDIPRVLIGNILNRGEYVAGVPRDIAVEIPLHVSKRGIHGIQTNGLPPAVMAHLLRDYVAPVNVELAAYEQRSFQLLTELIMLDPWTHSYEQARSLLEAILALPFHAEMRMHYQLSAAMAS